MSPVRLLLVLLPVYSFSQPSRRWAEIDKPATEAELRTAIEDVEQLSHDLQSGLKRYRYHLLAALAQEGYGRYHPLFRTSLNGFQQDQIDLDDLDEFKMGEFAYTLQSAGILLDPDPFADWIEIQKRLEIFDTRLNNAWRVVARSNIFVVHNADNIPRDTLRKLRKHWAAILDQVTNAHEHAMAVRAVSFEHGDMLPTPPNVRRLFEGGRYVVICGFDVCTSQPDVHGPEDSRIPQVQ